MAKRKGISLKAIALGTVVDTGGGLIGGMIINMVVALQMKIGGVEGVDFAQKKLEMFPLPIWMGLSLAIGLFLCGLGGYVAGRVSGKSQALHGGIVGGLSLLWGQAMSFLFPQVTTQIPIWFILSSAILAIPSGIVGGILAKKFK